MRSGIRCVVDRNHWCIQREAETSIDPGIHGRLLVPVDATSIAPSVSLSVYFNKTMLFV